MAPAEAGEIYNFENMKIESKTIPWMFGRAYALRTASLRSPGEPPRVLPRSPLWTRFAAEVRIDPVQFRLAYLKNHKRIVEAFAHRGGEIPEWTERPSPRPPAANKFSKEEEWPLTCAMAVSPLGGRSGSGYFDRKDYGHAGHHRLWTAACLYNPDGVKNQIEETLCRE